MGILAPVRRAALLIVAVLVAMFPGISASADPPGGPGFEPTTCPFTMPDGFVDGRNARCGFVVAPIHHASPGDGTVKLAVAVFRAEKPSKVPVVYLGGGPSTTLDRLIPPQVRSFTTARDVVIVDQRGVEFSDPALNCPELIGTTETDLETLVSGPDMARHQAAAILRCRDRWESQGIDLAAFNFTETAADVGDVIDALDYHKADLYGVSFGTQIAIQAMRHLRDRIHSVILNSGFAPDKLTQDPNLLSEIREQVWQACAADAKCSTAFPDIADVFASTKAALDRDPVSVAYQLNGETHHELVNGARFSGLVGATTSTPYLVWQVAHGNTDVLSPAIRGSMGFSGPNFSVGAHLSMICSYLGPGPLPPTTVYGIVCPNWPTVPLSPEVKQPISSSIPTLLVNGTFDSLVPVASGGQLADELQNSTSVVIPGASHAFAPDANPCLLGIQHAFFGKPHVTPDTSCVARLKISFFGS